MLLALAAIGLISLILYYIINKDLLNELVGNRLLNKFKRKKTSAKQN